jgi:hypothetical protein
MPFLRPVDNRQLTMSIDKFVVDLLNAADYDQRFSTDLRKIPTTPKGSMKTSTPFALFRHFFKLCLTKALFAGTLKNFAIPSKGLRRALMGIWSLKSLLSKLI